jgi:hypothetical protein
MLVVVLLLIQQGTEVVEELMAALPVAHAQQLYFSHLKQWNTPVIPQISQ